MNIPNDKLIKLHTLYSEKNRYYHTMNHLSKMIYYLNMISKNIYDWQLVSIYYHDAIYDVTRKDNEEMSANLFQEDFKNSNLFSPEEYNKITKTIRGTKDYMSDGVKYLYEPEILFVLDADLAGLGDDFDIFIENRKNVEKEFLLYFSEDVVQKGTIDFYQNILKKHSIYNTFEAINLWENNARYNIKTVLNSL